MLEGRLHRKTLQVHRSYYINACLMFFKGFSDPYLIISFNGQKKRSKIIMQNLNPRWNQKFVFDLPEKPAKDGHKLVIECWDWDMIGSDDFMGIVNLHVNSEDIKQTEKSKEEVETWKPLQGRGKKKEEISGDICYSIEFFPEDLCDFKEEVLSPPYL
jgi:Ca2+-dependent lipid-binding protein